MKTITDEEIVAKKLANESRNDRNRPFAGPPHMWSGARGNVEVTGLTMRDIQDCIVQGIISSSPNPQQQIKAFPLTITESVYHTGDWEYLDIYEETSELDLGAVIQNTLCYIEDYMGNYPNVESPIKIRETKIVSQRETK